MNVPDHTPLEAARVKAGLSPEDLWLAYFALGGSATEDDLRDVVLGEAPADPYEYDIVVHALNERFHERGMDHPLDYLQP